jgi:histidyl-tRNA synthetase
MKGANTRGAAIVLLAGGDEVAANQFQMKTLATGDQVAVTTDQLSAAVREVLES